MSGRRSIALVAGREIRERLRSKAFIASTVFILALVAGSALLGQVMDPQKTYRVAVTKPVPEGLATALRRAAQPFDDAQVRLRTVDSASAGRRLLEDGEVDALLLLATDRLVFRKSVDPKAAAVADSAVRAVRNELPPAPELTTATLHPPDDEPGDAAVLVAAAGARQQIPGPGV
jgi:ABC-2 type transport system permease protein